MADEWDSWAYDRAFPELYKRGYMDKEVNRLIKQGKIGMELNGEKKLLKNIIITFIISLPIILFLLFFGIIAYSAWDGKFNSDIILNPSFEPNISFSTTNLIENQQPINVDIYNNITTIGENLKIELVNSSL